MQSWQWEYILDYLRELKKKGMFMKDADQIINSKLEKPGYQGGPVAIKHMLCMNIDGSGANRCRFVGESKNRKDPDNNKSKNLKVDGKEIPLTQMERCV